MEKFVDFRLIQEYNKMFDNPKKVLTQRFLYRSRMYEKEIFADSLDLYSLSSELKDFLKHYETNNHIETKTFTK